MSDNCTVCGNKIRTQCYRGTGVCGELCRKKLTNDSEKEN